jgi:intein/homing endonuclease
MDDNKTIIETGYYKNSLHYNTEEWCASALHFKEFGTYTNYPINTHPSSRYYKFWEEEARRSVYGYDIGRDKIPGYFYFYLNYSPIYKAIELEEHGNDVNNDGISMLYEQTRAERIFTLPDFWDGDYQYFWYLEDAEISGEHGIVIKSRRRGYSYKAGSMCDRNYYLIPGSKSFVFADDKAFLIEDGLLSKAWEMMDHIESHTPWGKRRQKHDTTMYKRASYVIDQKGLKIEKGFQSEIMGVSLKNDYQKVRGKGGKLVIFEESGKNPNLLQAWNISLKSMQQGRLTHGLMCGFGTGGCVCAGTKVWNNEGNLINIEDLKIEEGILGFNGKSICKENISYWQEPYEKPCLRITLNSGRKLECSIDHPLLWSRGKNFVRTCKNYVIERTKLNEFKEAKDIIVGDEIAVINSVNIYGNNRLWEPRLIGWLIGDGTYGLRQTAKLSNCEQEIIYYIETRFKTNVDKCYVTKTNKIYKEILIHGICDKLRNIGIYGQTKLRKTLPLNIHSYCKEDICELIGGLFDTDGYINYRLNKKRGTYIYELSLSSVSDVLLLEIQLLLQKLGIHSYLRKRMPRENNPKDKNPWFELTIADVKSIKCFVKNITLFPKEKQTRLIKIKKLCKNVIPSFNRGNIRYEKVISIDDIGIKPIYNLTTNKTHTYIANGIITHNTEDSDFMGLEQLFYQGKAYNIHLVPNIWDEGSMNSKCGHFVSIEQNLEGAMDKDGNSIYDIARSITDHARNKVIKNTKNPESIIRYIAEEPRTPQEAVMRIGGTIFPINDLKHHLNYLTSNPDKFENQEYLGVLEINEESQKIEWKPDDSVKPIRKFPELDKRNREGAIVIYEHPVITDGLIPWGVYLAGNDTYDHDESTTDSLGSTFIMNRLTERIVAEYTGRPSTANEYYENVRRLLIYYRAICNYENNWKGLFTYLNNRHSSYLLCDTPRIIADKIFDKSLLNRGKGTPGTEPIQKWGREQILIWLTTPIEPGSEILNLHRIRSIPLLQELIYWNSKGNFDRVDAIQMLMILKEDMQNIMVEDPNKRPQDNISPFFLRQQMFQEKLREKNDPVLNHLGKRLQLLNRNKS